MCIWITTKRDSGKREQMEKISVYRFNEQVLYRLETWPKLTKKAQQRQQNKLLPHGAEEELEGLHRHGVDDYLEEHKRTRRAGFYMARRERETVLADWGWCSN